MFPAYCSALWTDVVARMSGLASLVFTGLGVYSPWFSGQQGTLFARKFCWIAAILCFLYANFRLWADEHTKVISQKPKLEMVVEEIHYEYQPTRSQTALIFAVSLTNSGAPSIAKNWRGLFSINGVKEPLHLFHLTDRWTIARDQQKLTILPKDQIILKTLESKLDTGDCRIGRLFFDLPGNRVDQLRALNYEVAISCSDFQGKAVVGTFRPSPTPITGVKIFPGETGGFVEPDLASPKETKLISPASEKKYKAKKTIDGV